jgi:hypothetical protein
MQVKNLKPYNQNKLPEEPKKAIEKVGRPPFEITPERRELAIELAGIHCTNEEMAHILGCHIDTFYVKLKEDPSFSDALKKARADGKASLRRLQFKEAEKGNAAVLIWLGKNQLGQRDKLDIESKQDINIKKIEIQIRR